MILERVPSSAVPRSAAVLFIRCVDCQEGMRTDRRDGVWREKETNRYVCCSCVKKRARVAAGETFP